MVMKKVTDFGQFKNVKNMSFNNFNRWVTSIYGSGYQDGYDEATEGAEIFDEDSLYDFLISVKGIGCVLADRIVQAMSERGKV